MIRIKQLHDELTKFGHAYNTAQKEFTDPLYIAWIVDMVFDGKAPENTERFSVIIKARKSSAFRNFWKAYNEMKKALSNFQIVNMGVVSNVTRERYVEQYKKDYPGEVPF